MTPTRGQIHLDESLKLLKRTICSFQFHQIKGQDVSNSNKSQLIMVGRQWKEVVHFNPLPQTKQNISRDVS